jgi:addiction module RelE/StbE family toxin
MTRKPIFTPAALEDIHDIKKYLSAFYASTADKFLDELEKRITAITDLPYMYEAFVHDPFYRKMPLDDYLVFYHVDEKSCTVEIHRILHSSKNIKKIQTND